MLALGVLLQQPPQSGSFQGSAYHRRGYGICRGTCGFFGERSRSCRISITPHRTTPRRPTGRSHTRIGAQPLSGQRLWTLDHDHWLQWPIKQIAINCPLRLKRLAACADLRTLPGTQPAPGMPGVCDAQTHGVPGERKPPVISGDPKCHSSFASHPPLSPKRSHRHSRRRSSLASQAARHAAR